MSKMRVFSNIILLFSFMGLFLASCQRIEVGLDPRITAKAVQAHMQGALLGSKMSPSEGMLRTQPAPNAEVGAALFARYCDSCHISGKKAPRVVGVFHADPNSESDLAIVRFGLEEMPAFRNILTHFQIMDILRYLQREYEQRHGVSKSEELSSQNEGGEG
ncbi:MAG: cytochrome c [Bradymonadales bacterium]|jgi:mono/diheme cytochrome c family protein